MRKVKGRVQQTKVITKFSFAIFLVIVLALVASVYFFAAGKLDIYNLVELLITDTIIILVPLFFTFIIVGLGYVILEALGRASIDKPSSWVKYFVVHPAQQLAFQFIYLLCLYIAMAIFGLFFLAQFGKSNPTLQLYIPFIIVGNVLLFRIFSKLGKKKLANLIEEIFLVALILAFAYAFTLDGNLPQTTLPSLHQELVIIIAAFLDFVFLEILLGKSSKIKKFIQKIKD